MDGDEIAFHISKAGYTLVEVCSKAAQITDWNSAN